MRYHTSSKREVVLQRNAILSMVELCQHSNTPLSVENASKYLAGDEGSSDVHSPLYHLKVLKPWTIRRLDCMIIGLTIMSFPVKLRRICLGSGSMFWVMQKMLSSSE